MGTGCCPTSVTVPNTKLPLQITCYVVLQAEPRRDLSCWLHVQCHTQRYKQQVSSTAIKQPLHR